jgi:hypothetical protein
MTEPILPTLADDLVEPIAWSVVERALHGWLTDLLGLDPRHVVWERQNVPQPSYPYVSLHRFAVTKEGGIDELRHKYIAADDELEMRWQGPRLFTLTISAHVDRLCPVDEDAQAISSKVVSDLSTDATNALLRAGGMSVVTEGAVQDTSVVINGQWISRASVDVRLRVGAMYRTRETFIEKVQIESVGLDPPVSFEVDSTP